jgi:hypothetical protein
MRALRNIAIIALLALIVAAVPGGGEVASAVITALTLCFLAVIVLFVQQIYRQNQLAYLSLSERSRAVLLVAMGAIVLLIAAADEMFATGLGTVAWIALIVAAGFAIFRVWTEAQSY